MKKLQLSAVALLLSCACADKAMADAIYTLDATVNIQVGQFSNNDFGATVNGSIGGGTLQIVQTFIFNQNNFVVGNPTSTLENAASTITITYGGLSKSVSVPAHAYGESDYNGVVANDDLTLSNTVYPGTTDPQPIDLVGGSLNSGNNFFEYGVESTSDIVSSISPIPMLSLDVSAYPGTFGFANLTFDDGTYFEGQVTNLALTVAVPEPPATQAFLCLFAIMIWRRLWEKRTVG